jgi:enamine deaminase RidA (YjgF/YER057c/UK114 family)
MQMPPTRRAKATRKEAFGAGSMPTSPMIGVDKLLDPRFLVEIKVTAYK